MLASLQDQPGIAISGQHWTVQDVTLWQSTNPDTILYSSNQPVLAKDSENGHFQFALSLFSQWQEGSYKVNKGSALFTITSTPQYDLQTFQQLKERWRNVLLNKGYKGNPNPKFLPLPLRNGKVQILLDDTIGKANETGNSGDAGTSGGPTSLMIELTGPGAEQWGRGIREKNTISGSVKFTYEYPQMMPEVDAHVIVHGLRVFTYLSRQLNHTDDGTLYGSSADIQSAWSDLVGSGDVEIKLSGTLPKDIEDKRQELLSTFADQARQQLFDSLFTPILDTQSASANGNNKSSSSTNYTLRWHKRSDAADLSLTIKYEAWNWLTGSLEADFNTLFQLLDQSYVNTVYTQVSIPFSIVVDPDPMVDSVAASLTFDEGHPPEAPVFGKTGGTIQYFVSSSHPDVVTIRYHARVNFVPANWPLIEIDGSANLVQGENHIVLKPGTWIRRITFYMYVREGNKVKSSSEVNPNDYLILNVIYQGPNSIPLIKASSHITPQVPVEFSYPLDPASVPGQTKFSAFGVINGQSVRSQESPIDQGESSIFILTDQNGIQLVSKQAVLPENDALAERLLHSGARPIVVHSTELSGSDGHNVVAETGKSAEEDAIAIDNNLQLVPQPTPVSCWVASLAMVVGYRDSMSNTPDTIAAAAGMDVNTSYGWSDIEKAVAAWKLQETGPASAMPSDWATMLQTWGPLWIVEVGAPYHAVVLSGMHGDGTPGGTQVTVYNPWPPNQGAIEYKTFLDFDQEFGLGAGAGAMIVHA